MTVRSETGMLHSLAVAVARAEEDSSRAVSEVGQGPEIMIVEYLRIHLGRDEQNIVVHSGPDQRVGHADTVGAA